MNIRLNMTQSSSLKTIKCRCCGNEISAVNTQLDCNDLLGLLKSTNEFIHMPCRCSNCGCVTLWENLTYDETTKDLLKSPEYTKYLYSMTYDEAFKNWVLLFNIIKHNHYTIHAIVCKIKAYDYIEQIYPDTKEKYDNLLRQAYSLCYNFAEENKDNNGLFIAIVGLNCLIRAGDFDTAAEYVDLICENFNIKNLPNVLIQAKNVIKDKKKESILKYI